MNQDYIRMDGVFAVQVITADGLSIADAAGLVNKHVVAGVYWPSVIRVPLRDSGPSSRCRCYRLHPFPIGQRKTALYEEDSFTPAQREIIAQAATSAPPPPSCST